MDLAFPVGSKQWSSRRASYCTWAVKSLGHRHGNLVILHKLQSYGFEYIRRNKRLPWFSTREISVFRCKQVAPGYFPSTWPGTSKKYQQHKGVKKYPLAIRHSKSLLVGKGWFQLLPWFAGWSNDVLASGTYDQACQHYPVTWPVNDRSKNIGKQTTAQQPWQKSRYPLGNFKGRWENEEFLFHRWKKVSSQEEDLFKPMVVRQTFSDSHAFQVQWHALRDKQQLLATLNKMATVPWDEFLGFHQGLKDENNHSNGCVTVSWSTHVKTGKYWAVGCVQVLNHLRSVGSDSWRQKVSQILPTSSHPSEQICECHLSIHVPPKLSYHSSLSTACAMETGNMKVRYLPL